MSDFRPTDEQSAAVELALTGRNVAIEALAGAGKTSTLKLIAGASGGTGRYIAFNKKIVTDAQASFPASVQCSTAHSLAYRTTGRRFGMAKGRRMTSSDMARALGLGDVPWLFDRDEETLEVHPAAIASLAKRAVDAFCMTADAEIGRRHVPFLRAIDAPGQYANNNDLAERVFPIARRIWEDMKRPNSGSFDMGFNYLKLWQLEGPVIEADYILFDEAQDANPLMMAIVEAQDCQKIWVGDTQQQIYSWNGAVNALAKAEVDDRTWLTQSFRFGPEIAEAANLVLERLGAPKMVVGAGPKGEVGIADRPDVYLGRTNGEVVSRALHEMEKGLRVCVQGGTKEIVWFAECAEKLEDGRRVEHPDLGGFDSWGAVQRYVDTDETGSDLKLMVRLVDKFGARTIIEQLATATDERRADVTVSTAHKSKGAEWHTVKLLGDFPAGDKATEEELRLLYVAATRAKRFLDRSLADLEGIESKPAVGLIDALIVAEENELQELDGFPASDLPVPARGSRGESARDLEVEAARAKLAGRVLGVACSTCMAMPGEICRIVRGPRKGHPTVEAHVPRVDAGLALSGGDVSLRV